MNAPNALYKLLNLLVSRFNVPFEHMVHDFECSETISSIIKVNEYKFLAGYYSVDEIPFKR